MKKTITFALIVVVAAVGAYLFLNAGHAENPDSPEYAVGVVQKRDIRQTVTATGIVRAKVGAEVKVGAQVSGTVKELSVNVGSVVKRGQLLAIIDPEGYRARRDLTAGAKQLAEIEKKYALIDLNRARALHESRVIPDQQLDEATQRYEIAGAKLQQAKADSVYAELQLSYTTIRSPITGVVASISTQKGETVAASFTSPTFVTIIDPTSLELWAYVDETDIGRIEQGEEVTFTVDTYPGIRFEGQVQTIYPKAEIRNNVVDYVAVIGIRNQPGTILRPEMTATIQIVTAMKTAVAVLPRSAVQTEDGKTYVSVLKSGKPERRWIVTGVSDDRVFEVLSGVTVGDNIILNKKGE